MISLRPSIMRMIVASSAADTDTQQVGTNKLSLIPRVSGQFQAGPKEVANEIGQRLILCESVSHSCGFSIAGWLHEPRFEVRLKGVDEFIVCKEEIARGGCPFVSCFCEECSSFIWGGWPTRQIEVEPSS
jgi:hypothetical protein